MLCIAHMIRATDISVRGSGSALDQCLHCGATGSGFDSRSGHPHTFGYNILATRLGSQCGSHPQNPAGMYPPLVHTGQFS